MRLFLNLERFCNLATFLEYALILKLRLLQASCKKSESLDANDIANYDGIKSTTDSMIESIKHTIVLLQIAKSYNIDTLFKGEGKS